MAEHEDRAWRDYSRRFRTNVLPKLLDSAIFLSIGSEVGDFDVKQATELGAALLCDKPLLLLIPRGRTVGARLRRAADVVLDDADMNDPAFRERLADAMRQISDG
jgi:hypothetical protein